MGMDVKLPNLGEGADSGTVVSVLVKPGASVKKGQNIIELETGKAVAPIPAPADGKIGRIAVKEGDTVSVGQLILVLETGDGETGADKAPESAAEPAAPRKSAPPPRGRAATRRRPEAETGLEEQEDLEPEGEELVEEIINENPAAGPYVRRVARDLAIDLRVIQGTGRSGQVSIGDLRDYVARLRSLALRPRRPARGDGAPARPAPVSIDFAQWGPITRKPMSQLRKTIAQRMVESATTIPAVTQFHEADITDLMELRSRHAAAFEKKGARLTLTSFVLKVLPAVLARHPIFNASLDEAAGEIVFKEYFHIGLAVDTEAGLLVPVIRDADKKDLVQLSKDVQDLAAKARDRKLGLADMQGGTFTVSNQGGIGGGAFTPVINQPEVAILGLGRSAPKPVVRDGAVVVRTMLPMGLTYDHRLIDGGSAARFIVDLAAALENFPEADVKAE